MLEGIRKKRNSLLILMVFAAIIIVFIFWGVGPTGNGGGVVATVDGNKISTKEYLDTYRNEYEYYKSNFPGEFNEDVAEKLNLKQRSLDILINRTLVVKAARKNGVRVGKEEIQGAVTAMAAFQKAGVFDKDTYFKVLSANRLKPADFEENVRLDLLAGKMRQRVISNASVTDEEVKEAYNRENRGVNLSFVEVPTSRFIDTVEVSEDEAKGYLDLNRDEFMVPAQIDVFHAYVDYGEISGRIRLSDGELRDYYEANQARFETPPEIRARHILIKAKGKGPGAREAARGEAAEVLSMLKSGASFAELAKSRSDDPGTASKGGDLGWFPRGIMVKPFEDAAFSLEQGELSEVVESPYGYHIILVLDKKPAGRRPFEAVKGEIRKVLLRQKAQSEAAALLRPVEGAMRGAESVEDLRKAASGGLVHAVSTGLVVEGDKSVGIMRDQRIEDTVFTMRPGEVSSPVESGDRLYVIKLRDRIPAHVPMFEEIADKVTARMREKKAGEEALARAREIAGKARDGEDLKKLAAAEGLRFDSTGLFTRAEGFMPKTGVFVGNIPGLFELTEDKPFFDDVLSSEGGWYVVKLIGAREADPAGLAEVAPELSKRLLAEKQEEAMGKWLDGLRSSAKIRVYPERL